jgi:hypothetical protein
MIVTLSKIDVNFTRIEEDPDILMLDANKYHDYNGCFTSEKGL